MNRRRFLQSLVAVFSLPSAPALSFPTTATALSAATAVPTHARSWAIYMSTLHGECTPLALQNLLNISAVDAKKYVAQLVAEGVLKPNPLLQKSVSKLVKGDDDDLLGKVKERLEMKTRREADEMETTEVNEHPDAGAQVAQELTEIINWRQLDERVTLSGQPTEEQLARIGELGVSDIINLGPHSNKGALEDEAGTVAALGMNYIYIPVDFDNPTDEDFARFCEAMESLEGRKVHVHCIYNARVSAFFYRYACEGRGGQVSEAHALMDGIWRPGGVWAKFIGNEDAVDRPNQYLGYDY